MSQGLSEELLAAIHRVEQDLPRMITSMIDERLADIPDEGPRHPTRLVGQLQRLMEFSGRELSVLILQSLIDQTPVKQADLVDYLDCARDRASEGVPSEDVVDACFTGGKMLWHELVSQTPAEAHTELLHLSERYFAQTGEIAYAIGRATREEYFAAHLNPYESIHDLAHALIRGAPADELAQRIGIEIAPSYAVLALAFGANPAESELDEVGRSAADRRKVLHVRQRLERVVSPHILTALDQNGGYVLIPPTADHAAQTSQVELLTTLMPKLAVIAGAPLTAGYAWPTHTEAVPDTSRRANRLLHMALDQGKRNAVATLEEHLLEYHLSHASDATTGFRAIVERLSSSPELLQTLTVFFDQDFNRRRTARHLQVHPNTIDNRLARIAEIAGVDPRTSRGLMMLGSALATKTRGSQATDHQR
jgi:sugar diacid utilization regulator